MKHFPFSLCLVPPEIRDLGPEKSYQENREDCLIVCARTSIFGGLLEEKNPPRQSLTAGRWHSFPGLQGPLEIQSDTPEALSLSQFGGAYLVN